MVCLGLEPGAAGWQAQTNPLSYGGKYVHCKILLMAGFEPRTSCVGSNHSVNRATTPTKCLLILWPSCKYLF